mgnify:CR=1 FL=1
MENNNFNIEKDENEIVVNSINEENEALGKSEAEEATHEQTLKLMSPMQMVIRRFFRSKLSIIGLVMVVSLFLFCWAGPLFYQVSPTEIDKDGKTEYTTKWVEYEDENGNIKGFYQVIETQLTDNMLSKPSTKHPLGTDKTGKDVLARLMNGGKISGHYKKFPTTPAGFEAWCNKADVIWKKCGKMADMVSLD